MKYVKQLDGTLVACADDSPYVATLMQMGAQDRPQILDADHPEVVAMLAASARRAATTTLSVLMGGMRERMAKSQHYLQAARWPVQLPAAQAIIAGTASDLDTEMMALEARLRSKGETPLLLAQKVIANSRVFTLVGAAVDGIERAALDTLAEHAGAEPADFEQIVESARTTAWTELLAILTPLYGEAAAQALVTELAGPAPVAVGG